jgi:hypothetical protein
VDGTRPAQSASQATHNYSNHRITIAPKISRLDQTPIYDTLTQTQDRQGEILTKNGIDDYIDVSSSIGIFLSMLYINVMNVDPQNITWMIATAWSYQKQPVLPNYTPSWELSITLWRRSILFNTVRRQRIWSRRTNQRMILQNQWFNLDVKSRRSLTERNDIPPNPFDKPRF